MRRHLGIDFSSILVDLGTPVGAENRPKINPRRHRKSDEKKRVAKMAKKSHQTSRRHFARGRPDPGKGVGGGGLYPPPFYVWGHRKTTLPTRGQKKCIQWICHQPVFGKSSLDSTACVSTKEFICSQFEVYYYILLFICWNRRVVYHSCSKICVVHPLQASVLCFRLLTKNRGSYSVFLQGYRILIQGIFFSPLFHFCTFDLLRSLRFFYCGYLESKSTLVLFFFGFGNLKVTAHKAKGNST